MYLKKFLLFGLIAAVLPAFAEEAADRKTATSLKYVEHELDTRQNKFTAEQNKAMEYTNTAGDVQKRAVTSNLGTSTTDTSLPMVGGVNTKLNQKQDDIAPINDHTAVTYTGTSGKIGQKGIYQTTESYVEQSNNLIDAKTFNAALKRGLDSEFLCSEYKPGTDLCWVWSIHNNETSSNLFNSSYLLYADTWTENNGEFYGDTHKLFQKWFNNNDQMPVNCEPNTRYTLSYDIKMDGDGYGGRLRIMYSDGTYTDSTSYTTTDKPNYKRVTQTTDANKTVTGIKFAYTAGSGNTYFKNIQLEEGTTATPYQPYIGPTPFTTLVPAGYTPVEFIESNGTQYINTGITDVTNSEFTLVAQQTELLSGYPTLLGAMDGGAFKVVFAYGSTSHFYTQTGVGDSKFVISSHQDLNKHTFNLLTVGNVHTFTIDNATVIGNYPPVATTTYPLFLCARNRAGAVGNQVKQKVFSFSAKKNGALIQNLIPARRNRDDVVGMYDTVSGEFLTSVPANTNFTAGPDVNNIIYVPQNQ